MNPTETATYPWLMRQGYEPEEIYFRYRLNPDFLTADGKGWEVKMPGSGGKQPGRVVIFGAKQIADIRRFGPCDVLFWRLGASAPFATADFSELVIPGEWNGLLLRAAWQTKRAPGTVLLRSTADVDAVVALYANQDYRRQAIPYSALFKDVAA